MVIYQPFAAISPVTEEISIGGLLAYGQLTELLTFGFVMNVAWELADFKQPGEYTLSNGVVVHNARLDDSDEVQDQVPEILRAVRMLSDARSQGKKALVTCAQGRNRSGLVIAEHLVQKGWGADVAIERVQTARDRALTNDAFVDWLKRKR